MLAVWDCIPNCFQQHNKGFSFTGLIRQGEACFFSAFCNCSKRVAFMDGHVHMPVGSLPACPPVPENEGGLRFHPSWPVRNTSI